MMPGGSGLGDLSTILHVDIVARNLTKEGVAAARAELASLGAPLPEDVIRRQVAATEDARVRAREEYYRAHPDAVDPITGRSYGTGAGGTLSDEEKARIEQEARALAKARQDAAIAAAAALGGGGVGVGVGGTAGGGGGRGGLKTEEQVAAAQLAEYQRYSREELRSILRKEIADARAELERTTRAITAQTLSPTPRLGGMGSLAGIDQDTQKALRDLHRKVQTDLNAAIQRELADLLPDTAHLRAEIDAMLKSTAMGDKADNAAVQAAAADYRAKLTDIQGSFRAQLLALTAEANQQVINAVTSAQKNAASVAAQLAADKAADEWDAARQRELQQHQTLYQHYLRDTKSDEAALTRREKELAAAERAANNAADAYHIAQERAILHRQALYERYLRDTAKDEAALTKQEKQDAAAAAAARKAGLPYVAGRAGLSVAGGVAAAGALTQIYGAYQGMGLEYALKTAISQGAPEGPQAVGALYGPLRRDMPAMMAQYGITDWNAGASSVYTVLSTPGMSPTPGSKNFQGRYQDMMQVMKAAAMMQAFTSTSGDPLTMQDATNSIMTLMTDTGIDLMPPGPQKTQMIQQIANGLVQAHRFSRVPMQDLLQGSGRSFAQLTSMGLAPTDMLSAAAEMTQHGMAGSQAWTALTMFTTRLAAPTSVLGRGPEFASAVGIENVRKHGLTGTLQRIVAISRDMYARQQKGEVFYDAKGNPLPKYQSPADIQMQLFGDIRGSQRTFSQLVGFGDTGKGGTQSNVMNMLGQSFDPSTAGALDAAYSAAPGGNVSPFFQQFLAINKGIKGGINQDVLGGYQSVIEPTAEFQFHKMVADFKELADVANGPLSGNLAGIFHNIDGMLQAISSFEKDHGKIASILNTGLLLGGAFTGANMMERILFGTSNEKTLTGGLARTLGVVIKGLPEMLKGIWLSAGQTAAADMGAGIASKMGVQAISGGVATAVGSTATASAAGGAAGAAGAGAAATAATGLGKGLAASIAAGIAIAGPALIGLALGEAIKAAMQAVGLNPDDEPFSGKNQDQMLAKLHAARAANIARAKAAAQHAGGGEVTLAPPHPKTDLIRIFGGRGPLIPNHPWHGANILGDQAENVAYTMARWGVAHPSQTHNLPAIQTQIMAQLQHNPKALQDAMVGTWAKLHNEQAPMRGTKAFTDLVGSPDFAKWFGTASKNKQTIGQIAMVLATEFAAYWPHSPAKKGPLSKTPDLVSWMKGADWEGTLSALQVVGAQAAGAVAHGAGGTSAGDTTGGLGAFLPPGGTPTGSPAQTALHNKVRVGRQGQGGGYWQYASFGSTIVDPMLVRRVRSGVRYLPTPSIVGGEQDFAYDLFSGGMATPGGAGPAVIGPAANHAHVSTAHGAGGAQVSQMVGHLKVIADAMVGMRRDLNARPATAGAPRPGGLSPAERIRGARGMVMA